MNEVYAVSSLVLGIGLTVYFLIVVFSTETGATEVSVAAVLLFAAVVFIVVAWSQL